MTDVVISYAREDRRFVQRVHDALANQGRESWGDREGIAASAYAHPLSTWPDGDRPAPRRIPRLATSPRAPRIIAETRRRRLERGDIVFHEADRRRTR